jgi:bacillithiol synthase
MLHLHFLKIEQQNQLTMQKLYVPYAEIDALSKYDKAYAQNDESLKPFYKYDVSLDSFEQIIKDKQKDKTDRALLYKVLKAQYATVPTSDAVLANIEKLQSDNTFTIITAHQPTLFTGPLYYIYKLVSTVNLAKALDKKYPNYQFVPVFYMGSEDHDFDEISYLHLFNKTIRWVNDTQGPTGMMDTDSLAPTLAEVKEVLGNSENAQHITALLDKCYAAGKSYAQASFEFTNELFKAYGLVIALTSNADLKRSFIPIMKDELLNQSSKKLVAATIAQKEKADFKAQASPRDINLFYMQKGVRERILLENGIYTVNNRSEKFTEAQILEELDRHPERFSPNVILRPLYQELIFPNLCYIGGGGELAYWKERLTQFEYYHLNFPMLLRRNSVLWMDNGTKKKLDKLNLSITDIFGELEALLKTFIKKNTTEELSLANEKAAIAATFDSVLVKAKSIDNNLERSVNGEMIKILNALDKLEAKLISAEKRNHETTLHQIRSIRDKFFPNNGLQERYDNFLQFYLKHGDSFIETLMAELDPLNRDFAVLIED